MFALLLFAAVTFHHDVEPILQKHCQSCHRPGEIGPMPLLTYQQVRPWAKAIRDAVLTRKMPPWFADPHLGSFRNNPSLTETELRVMRDWANGGALEGPRAESPPSREWPNGWQIATPDLVVTMPKPFSVNAESAVDYQYFVLPVGLADDRWVRFVEIRPGERRLVHHAVLYVREKGSDWLRFANSSLPQEGERFADILAIYTPGTGPQVLPAGMAKKLPAGADLVLQVHYTSGKTNMEDRTSVGLWFAPDRPQKRVLTLQMGNYTFRIPPGERDFKVTAFGTMPRDATLLSLFPHMHLRGTAFEYQIAEPGGHFETLLAVKPYDFYWQLNYVLATPRILKKGTRLIWTGHFDNSGNNEEVRYGEQSWQEMMIGFFDVAVDPSLDKRQFLLH